MVFWQTHGKRRVGLDPPQQTTVLFLTVGQAADMPLPLWRSKRRSASCPTYTAELPLPRWGLEQLAQRQVFNGGASPTLPLREYSQQTQVGHSCPTCTALHLRQQSAVQKFVRIAIHTPSPLSWMNELSKNGCQPNTITPPAYKKPSKYRKIRAYRSLRNYKKYS